MWKYFIGKLTDSNKVSFLCGAERKTRVSQATSKTPEIAVKNGFWKRSQSFVPTFFPFFCSSFFYSRKYYLSNCHDFSSILGWRKEFVFFAPVALKSPDGKIVSHECVRWCTRVNNRLPEYSDTYGYTHKWRARRVRTKIPACASALACLVCLLSRVPTSHGKGRQTSAFRKPLLHMKFSEEQTSLLLHGRTTQHCTIFSFVFRTWISTDTHCGEAFSYMAPPPRKKRCASEWGGK